MSEVDNFLKQIEKQQKIREQLQKLSQKASETLKKLKCETISKSNELMAIQDTLSNILKLPTTPLVSKLKIMSDKRDDLERQLKELTLQHETILQETNPKIEETQERHDDTVKNLMLVIASKTQQLERLKNAQNQELKELQEQVRLAGIVDSSESILRKHIKEYKPKIEDSETIKKILKRELIKNGEELERLQKEKKRSTIPAKCTEYAAITPEIKRPNNKNIPPLKQIGINIHGTDNAAPKKKRKLYNPAAGLDYLKDLTE